ncbi:MAG: type II/IV secretion system protein [Firmicutes bacterium]|nr:type II/IV secretion system protein [Bacillota bacterium]
MFREFDYENKPVVDIVNEIIEDSISKGVSDIHFDPDEKGINVRIRIDGELHDYCRVPDSVKKNLATRVKIISGMNITESRLPQDGAIKHLDDERQLDMRVSSLPTIHGEKIVIRILDYTMSLAGLDTLGFSDHNLAKIKKVIASPNGIILVAGATGSGKSTTVYSMLQRLNKTETNIITVEDPVEMKMKGLNQVQVMSEIGLDFNTTLRSILRQDPDIIMIGEIRDGETARIAVRASITGHLVLSTIHTNNSLNTIERLLDMDIERYLLGTALNGIISQRLVKKLCPKCRKSRPTTAYEKNLFKKILNKDIEAIYEPVGCDDCFAGYRGRAAVHEVLVLNQDIRDAITNNMRKEDLRKLVYDKKNTFTLLEDGLDKAIIGITSIDEVIRVTSVEDDFGEDDEEIKKAFIGSDLGSETTTSSAEVLTETKDTISEDIIEML